MTGLGPIPVGAALVWMAIAAYAGGSLAFVLGRRSAHQADRDDHPVVPPEAVHRHEVVHRQELRVVVLNETLPTPYTCALGTVLRRIRQTRNLSQEDLAGLWSQPVACVAAIEDGTQVLSVEHLDDVCRLLDVRPGEVMQAVGRSLPRPVTLTDRTPPVDPIKDRGGPVEG